MIDVNSDNLPVTDIPLNMFITDSYLVLPYAYQSYQESHSVIRF